jgi:hypothetical protein
MEDLRLPPSERARNYRHGYKPADGKSIPEYTLWKNMRTRCNKPAHPDYAKYGGRGIKVAPQWEGFLTFLHDVGRRPSPDHSIDRIDNNGHYEPGNVRWATRKEQARNRRSSVRIAYRGEERTLAEWAEVAGMTLGCLHARIRYGGMTMDEAMTRPVRKQGRP